MLLMDFSLASKQGGILKCFEDAQIGTSDEPEL